jgi:hypothetical protein
LSRGWENKPLAGNPSTAARAVLPDLASVALSKTFGFRTGMPTAILPAR